MKLIDLKNQLNNQKLNKDSLIMFVKDNKFSIPQENRFGYLNVEGAYSYHMGNEIIFSDKKYGDVFALWHLLSGDVKLENKGNNVIDLRDLEYNMSFDGFNSSFLTVGKAIKQLEEYNEDSDLVYIGYSGDDAYNKINSVEIAGEVHLNTQDSYGHKIIGNYKYPCLILRGESFKNKVKEDETNESKIMNYKKFIESNKNLT